MRVEVSLERSSTSIKESVDMTNGTSIPDFDEIASLIKEMFYVLRDPYMQWADIARCAIRGLPHDPQRLAELEKYINSVRVDLRKAILIASEHFPEEQLRTLRSYAGMSKSAWRSFKKNRIVTTRNGFTLVSY
jgi:hypothetical protein